LPALRSQTHVPSSVIEKMVRDNPCAFYAI
jgi:hypothetical protein